MFALLTVLAVYLSIGIMHSLYHIAKGENVVRPPMYYVKGFPEHAILLAFVLYALLNWV